MTISIPHTGGASPEAVAALTARFGPLPADYLQFLSEHDGARPPANVLDGNDDIGVEWFIPAADIPSDVDNTEYFPKGLMPIAENGVGDYICIRLIDHKIYFLNRDYHEDSRVIYEDFNSFLNDIIIDDHLNDESLKDGVVFVWVHPKLKSGEIK